MTRLIVNSNVVVVIYVIKTATVTRMTSFYLDILCIVLSHNYIIKNVNHFARLSLIKDHTSSCSIVYEIVLVERGSRGIVKFTSPSWNQVAHGPRHNDILTKNTTFVSDTG